MNDLNKLIARHYQGQKLSSYRRDSIEQRLKHVKSANELDGVSAEDSAQDSKKPQFARKLNWLHVSAAAMLLVLSVALIRTNSIDTERSDKALHAAVLYHKTKLQLDFEGQSIAELQASMNELPFDLSLPAAISLDGYKLIGGRYCSINGQLAVHLRFFDDSSNQQYSLFQTSLAPQLERLDYADMNIEGTSARLWSENQSFYVQAGG